MVDEKKMQENYIMLQMISSQLTQLDQEVQTLEQRRGELLSLRQGLDSLDNIKKDSKSFSALGLGLYLPSKIENNEEVLLNVGANVFVKKNREDAKTLLDNQLEQAQLALAQLVQNMQLLETKALEIQTELKENV